MRNPGAWNFLKRIFGKEPKALVIPSFRFSWLVLEAAEDVEARFPALKPILGVGVFKPPLEPLLRAALANDTRDVERGLKAAVRALKARVACSEQELPAGLRALVEKASALKDAESLRLRADMERFAGKRALVERMEALRERLLEEAKQRRRSLRASKEELDHLYDKAHGAYANLGSTRVVKSGGRTLADAVEAIRAFFRSRGIGELSEDEANVAQEKTTVWLGARGRVISVDQYGGPDAVQALAAAGDQVLTIGNAAPFEREAWKYELVRGSEVVDRHCSLPSVLPEIWERANEGEDPEFTRAHMQSWQGDAAVLASAFDVDEAPLRPYLVQWTQDLVEKIWADAGLFVSLRASDAARFSVAGPWCYEELLALLAGVDVGTDVREPGATLWFATK